MTLSVGLIAGVMCFFPGPFLLDYLAKFGKLSVSKIEMILVGSLVWNFGWVSAAYIVAILTSSIGVFYSLSLVIGAAVVLLDLYETARRKPLLRRPSFDFDYALALGLIAVLGALVTTMIIAHTVYVEYDAIFYYLPMARSVVITGGLHFDPLHATGFTTTMPPALPLMYGSVLSFSGSLVEFGAAVRVIPVLYFMLTSLGVYALASEILEDSKLALTSTACFMSLPVLLSMSLNFALFLDMGLVFVATVSMYLVVRVGRHQGSDSFRWLALGVSFGLMMLMKDTAWFMVPSLFVLVFVPRLRGLGRNLAALLGALLFTGIYTFFFLVDVLVFHIIWIIPVQTTILGALVLAFLILRRIRLDRLNAPNGRQILLMVLPSASVVAFILRNLLEYRVVDFNLTWFSAEAARASQLIAGADPLTLPSFQNLLTILFSYDAGFMLLLPLVLGIAGILVAHEMQSETKLILLLLWLMLVDSWGWVSNFGYVGSDLRRLYDFAPILAVTAAAGVGFVSRRWRLQSSMVIRLVFFESLALLYLWTAPLSISAVGIILLSGRFSAIVSPTLQSFLIISIFFLVSFVPIRFKNPERSPDSRRIGRIIAIGALILLLVFPVYSFASPAIANSQETNAAVPAGWENNLSEVLNFINQNLSDNHTIIAFYARPIAYFTNHPVLDLTTYSGVVPILDLVGMNNDRAMQVLLNEGVHYLLVPLPGNNFYPYYLSLSRSFTFLSPASIISNPRLVWVSSFADYQLFRLISNTSSSGGVS